MNGVVEGSPADGDEFKHHALQKGDLLIRINGTYVGDQEHKSADVMKMMSRRPLKLTFFRPTASHQFEEEDEEDEADERRG